MPAAAPAKSLFQRAICRHGWIGLLISCSLAASAATAAPTELSQLRALSRHADVSVLIVRLSDDATIASLNPDLRLTPASTSKLFSTAAALEQLGPNHRFTSRFTSTGRLKNGTLDGNLVFVGDGDPSLDNRHLRELVARLQARGVQRVTGDLVIDDSLWGTVPCLTTDRCDAEKVATHAYSSPLSAAGVDFGTITGAIYPGEAPGEAARVVLDPAGVGGYVIDNDVTTVSSNGRTGVSVWREYDDGHSTLHLRGTLPAGSAPYRFARAVTGPAIETGRILATLLANAGIQVEGHITTRSTPAGSDGPTLAQIKSETLAEQIIPMLAYSNNYMADSLALDTAAASGFSPPLTLPEAAQTLETLSQRANRFAFPTMNLGHANFTSGSGLSLGNKVSARDLVALLIYMYHQNALFPSFYGAIPVPEWAPSRTLKHGDEAFETRLSAKTGTLSQPVTVRALAGYLRLSNGGFAAYGIVINGIPKYPHLSYRQTVTAYQQDLEQILAEY